MSKSTASAQRRKAASRSRDYRARLRAAGVPSARDVDASLSEALAFHIARDGATAALDVSTLIKTARIVLEREGYDPAASAHALVDRLAHRPAHLDPHHLPSLRPGAPDRIRPTKTGPWRTPLVAMIRHLQA